MVSPPDLSKLTEAEKDALILALWAQVQALTARIAELEARLKQPPKTPDNSGLPPSKGPKANRPKKEKRGGPRQGSVGRQGGGRPLAAVARWRRSRTSLSSPGQRYAPTVMPHSGRTITCCTPAMTRSTCRRFALW